MRLIPRALALTFVATALPAIAQNLPRLKPGAWEMTTDTGTVAGPPPEMLAKMPPQVVEQMKKSMAERRAPTRVCIGANDPEPTVFIQRMGGDVKCKNSPVRRSGNTHAWTSSCSGLTPGMNTAFALESDHTLTLTGDNFEHTAVRTKAEGMAGMSAGTTKTTGRFLGADCTAHGARTMEEMMQDAENRRAQQRRPPR